MSEGRIRDDEEGSNIPDSAREDLPLPDDHLPRPLTQAVIAASVSHLVHVSTGRLAFGVATLQSLQLNDISALSSFPYLQRVMLDHNHLTTLAPLASLSSLVHVSASANMLTEETVFPFLVPSVTTLESLDVSQNQLKSLQGVHRLTYLVKLCVNANELTTIAATDISGLLSLRHFEANQNKISSIAKGAFRKCPLQCISLAQNQLASIVPFLERSTTLVELNVTDNLVMHIAEITELTRLTTFDVAHNNIYDPNEVNHLTELPLLRYASLAGNPLTTSTVTAGIEKGSSTGAAAAASRNKAAAGPVASLPGGNGGVTSPQKAPTARPNGNGAATDQQVGEEDDDDDMDDNRSDIVRTDSTSAAPATSAAAVMLKQRVAGGSNAASSTAAPRAVPVAAKVATLRQPHNTPYQGAHPAAEDAREWAQLPPESRYRLTALWKVPQLLVFDGVPVTEHEASQAQNLEGGVDRDARIKARLNYVGSAAAGSISSCYDARAPPPPPSSVGRIPIASGSAALALRKAGTL